MMAVDESTADVGVEPAGSDANGRREAAAITALRHLGPATASEIARYIGLSEPRAPANVSTRLRQLEAAGRVRRTGKMVNPEGARGGPQVEWELMPANGEATDATTVLAGTGPVEERLRKMAERFGEATGKVERLTNELEAARERADRAERELRDEQERRRTAEHRADTGDTDALRKRLAETEARHDGEVTQLREQLADAERRAAQPEARPAVADDDRPEMRRQYFNLLLEQARADGAGEHVYDRIERLLGIGGEA